MTILSKLSAKTTKGRKPITPAQYEAKREEIVAAANKLFIDKGYQGVSMRSLAQAIGMSPMSLYRYFDNKRAILVHIWAEIFAKLFIECRYASLLNDDPVNTLEVYGQVFVSYWLEHPEHYKMIYGIIDQPDSAESFFAQNALVLSELVFLQNLLEDAGVKPEKSELACQQYICILHGVSHSLVTIPELSWRDHETLVSGLVKGLISQHNKNQA